MNNITLKIPYYLVDDQSKKVVSSFLFQYNNLLRFTYNRLKENPKLSTKEITFLQKQMNNIELMDQYYKTGVVYDCRTLLQFKNQNIIFGGKDLFLKRCQNKISKEDFKIQRLRPLQVVGAELNNGNCKFQILTDSQILFKANRYNHICLNLKSVGRKNSKLLQQLIKLQNNKQIALTYKLDLNYIYISFDYNKVKSYKYNVKENRVMALDLNPNYIGWSVVDWRSDINYNIVSSGVFDLTPINEKDNSLNVASNDPKKLKLNNKKDYEIIQIAYDLFKICNHYRCETFAVEDLSIESKDLSKGKKHNKLCNNQWNRNKLVNTVRKLVKASSTFYLEVHPAFSSFIGNLLFRKEKLPDMILASIEIGRRAYEFNLQYIKKSKCVEKNIIFPNLERVKPIIIQSLEELNYNQPFGDLVSLYYHMKKSKKYYRFLLSSVQKDRVFSKFYKKKNIVLHTYK